MVLNMLTTGAMVKIGKTYKNLMVDVKPTNIKLKDRAERIVCAITECTQDKAKKVLEKELSSIIDEKKLLGSDKYFSLIGCPLIVFLKVLSSTPLNLGNSDKKD